LPGLNKGYNDIMERIATTAELCATLGVTRKTIAEWAKAGVIVRAGHGRYKLAASLKGWAAHQRQPFAAAVDREPVPGIFDVELDAEGHIISARVATTPP
jgi:hypothetical protein